MRQKSSRQLARELGVSASYLSQVIHGKRPASEKVLGRLNSEVLSKMLSSSALNGKQHNLAVNTALCYNPDRLGIRLAVGRRTLNP